MRTICIILLAALLAVSASADVVLKYQFAKGQTLVYDCQTVGAGSIQAMGRHEPLETQTTFEFSSACSDVDKHGSMLLDNTVANVNVAATWGEEQIPVSLTIPRVQTLIAPSGRMLKTEIIRDAMNQSLAGPLQEQLGSSLAGSTLFDVQQFYGELHGPAFPTGPVAPGKRWREKFVLKTADGQDMTVTYTTRLLDFATLRGHDCARLQTDYEMPLELSLTGGELFLLQGTHRGTLVSYFDYRQGCLVQSDGTAETQITMATPQMFSEALSQQTSADVVLQSTSQVVLREEAR